MSIIFPRDSLIFARFGKARFWGMLICPPLLVFQFGVVSVEWVLKLSPNKAVNGNRNGVALSRHPNGLLPVQSAETDGSLSVTRSCLSPTNIRRSGANTRQQVPGSLKEENQRPA